MRKIFKKFYLSIGDNKGKVVAILVATTLFIYWNILPDPLFNRPYSLVLEDKDHRLLGALIAEDGQWRFPEDSIVPDKFASCIIAFEDKRFYSHMGVDLLALGRAFGQNVSSMERVSGASTLTMQVIRISRNKNRTIFEKGIEAIMATRLEIRFSKNEILAMYASHAPFGGNVVGLNAASWRYFGKSSRELSWGEAATLAVLPNNPSMIHPGRNRDVLKVKRDRLLDILLSTGRIDSTTCQLAKLESLPEKPRVLPMLAPHLLARILNEKKNGNQDMSVVHTTIDSRLQQRVNNVVYSHYFRLKENSIYNASVLVADVNTGAVLSYCGNVYDSERNGQVDNIQAPRSPGSTLKPLLFASMMDDGKLYPDMLVPDVPTYINSYTPKNFNYTYDGAIPASKALTRSLNIPAVHMLSTYTPQKFIYKLKSMGITTLKRSSKAYGLSLILGGAEIKLWDLASVYAGMSRTLNYYNETGVYRKNDFQPLNYYCDKKITSDTSHLPVVLSAGSIYNTFEALLKVARPDEEKFWTTFSSGRKIAWKTGTSFGDRDGWAIGVTQKYVVAVWVGNSNGEGRPGITGIGAAAPLLFDVFNLLPQENTWFKKPTTAMQKIMVCKESGFAASDACIQKEEQHVPLSENPLLSCAYHHWVYLDKNGKNRVHSDCEAVSYMIRKSWFVLPPSMEKFYKLSHPGYQELPPFKNECEQVLLVNHEHPMDLLYPKEYTRIQMPRNAEGKLSPVVFEAVHTNLSATLYWHMDEKYLGKTSQGIHEMGFIPGKGVHKLTVLDDAGNKLEQQFEVMN